LAVSVPIALEGEEKEAEIKGEELELSPDELAQKLQAAEAKAAEYLNGWQRARADYANYKKRVEREQAEIAEVIHAGLITQLLPVLDDFERAFAVLPDNQVMPTWVEGVALIHRKLRTILENQGLSVIKTERQQFDPRYHEAISYEVADGFEEGEIIAEVQKGYRLGERVLRPSVVRVARSPKAAEQTA